MAVRKRLALEQPYNYRLEAGVSPRLTVQLGEEFEVETEDAFSGEYNQPEHAQKLMEGPELKRIPAKLNPVNGPIYVEGVEKGDILVLHILDVLPAEEGWVAKIPGFGQLAHDIRWKAAHGPNIRPMQVEKGPSGTTSDGTVVFPRDDTSKPPIKWPAQPFFGTVGVAPDLEAISSLTGPYVPSKGCYGGNWDARDVKAGAKVMLQAYHDGGLFFVGDMHASQGDGEFAGIACECPGTGIFKCEVIKNKKLPYARIEKPESIVQLNNGSPLDRAIDNATIWLMDWLCQDYGFEQLECVDLLATCPGFKYNVYQSVPTDHYTVGAEILKEYIE